jgi:periplasmic protein TonB
LAKRERVWQLNPARGTAYGDADRLARARQREEQRWRKARSLGIIGTVLIHLILLLLFRQTTLPPYEPLAAAGPAQGDLRPTAGGGSGMTMVEVRPEQPPPEEEVPQPVPVPTEVIVVPPPEVAPASPEPSREPAPAPSLPGVGAPGTGGNDGLATGPGTETGTGDGGGGSGDGGASRVIPPTPRGVFIPPAGRPASARGQEITVWVFVTENGRVQRNSVRLEPPTSDTRYNQRLIQSVSEWVFDPARQGGRPVPVWYPFQIIL